VDDSLNLDAQQFPSLSFCIKLMQSEAIYNLLSQFTNMALHPSYQKEEEDQDQDGKSESSESGMIVRDI